MEKITFYVKHVIRNVLHILLSIVEYFFILPIYTLRRIWEKLWNDTRKTGRT